MYNFHVENAFKAPDSILIPHKLNTLRELIISQLNDSG